MAQKLKFGNGVWANKEGSTLAYNDENGNYKPLPFNFTRSSSATRVNKQGLIEVVKNNKPRIDYLDSAKGVLLLEPVRSNLFTYSEAINQGSWTKSNASVLENTAISPNGTLNAETFSITSNFGFFYQAPSLASGTTVTQSIFVKNINADRINLQVRTSSTAGLAVFFFDNSEITNVTLTNGISADFDYYGNGWYRVYLTCTTTETNQLFRFQLNESEMSCYVWGAQVEAGSYPTSYIPTQGAAVTRVAETASGSGNSEVFNDSEGVLYFEGNALANDGTGRKITLNNGTNSNVLVLEYTSTSNQIRVFLSNGALQFNEYVILSDSRLNTKFGIKYKVNDFALWINGFELASDNLGTTFSAGTLTKINFDDGSGFADFYGSAKQIQYYDTALTDTELEYLTSYRSWEEMVNELNLNIIYNG